MEQQTPEQPAPQDSVEDRIGAILDPSSSDQSNAAPETASDDAPADTDAAPADEAAPVEETFEVEIEGTKYVLPKKLEKGFMQERDYTQKSQQLADQKRLAETQLAQAKMWAAEREFTQSISQEQATLTQIEGVLKQYDALNWREMSTDDIVRTKLEMDRLEKQRQSVEQAINGKRDEFVKAQQQTHQQIIAQGQEYLTKKIPGWNAEIAKSVAAFAVERGIPQVEVAQITNPVHVEILYDAMKYRELQGKAKPAAVQAKQIKTTPSNPMSQQTKEMLNYRKTIQKFKPGSPERQKAAQDRVAAIFGK